MHLDFQKQNIDTTEKFELYERNLKLFSEKCGHKRETIFLYRESIQHRLALTVGCTVQEPRQVENYCVGLFEDSFKQLFSLKQNVFFSERYFIQRYRTFTFIVSYIYCILVKKKIITQFKWVIIVILLSEVFQLRLVTNHLLV